MAGTQLCVVHIYIAAYIHNSTLFISQLKNSYKTYSCILCWHDANLASSCMHCYYQQLLAPVQAAATHIQLLQNFCQVCMEELCGYITVKLTLLSLFAVGFQQLLKCLRLAACSQILSVSPSFSVCSAVQTMVPRDVFRYVYLCFKVVLLASSWCKYQAASVLKYVTWATACVSH